MVVEDDARLCEGIDRGCLHLVVVAVEAQAVVAKADGSSTAEQCQPAWEQRQRRAAGRSSDLRLPGWERDGKAHSSTRVKMMCGGAAAAVELVNRADSTPTERSSAMRLALGRRQAGR